jgi:hypothetical protein
MMTIVIATWPYDQSARKMSEDRGAQRRGRETRIIRPAVGASTTVVQQQHKTFRSLFKSIRQIRQDDSWPDVVTTSKPKLDSWYRTRASGRSIRSKIHLANGDRGPD